MVEKECGGKDQNTCDADPDRPDGFKSEFFTQASGGENGLKSARGDQPSGKRGGGGVGEAGQHHADQQPDSSTRKKGPETEQEEGHQHAHIGLTENGVN